MICKRYPTAIAAMAISLVLVAWAVPASGAVPDVTDSNTLLQFTAGEVGFEVGAFNPNLPLVIGGELSWNTFLGGGGNDEGGGIAVDGQGNVYVTGYSQESWGSPVRPYTGGVMSWDAFVAKLDPNGSLVWNTFLGGSQADRGHGIAVDGQGNVYVTGYSQESWGSPIRPHTYQYDAFVAKLDANGSLVWNTFFGGGEGDTGYGIAVDGYGNSHVTGFSALAWGSPVRPFSNREDAFVAKLDANGSLVWSTFLGGGDCDRGSGIAVDGTGNMYVTGNSYDSWGSPTRPYTHWDAFAARLDPNGSLAWNTFLGDSGEDGGRAIAVDGSGYAYVSGESLASWGSPVRPYTADWDAFAAKLDTGNGSLVWNTFLGGLGEDTGKAIAVDGNGYAYVSGTGHVWGSPIRPYTAELDAFAARLRLDGSLLWNTFLGGSGQDGGCGIAVDGNLSVYVTGSSLASWGSPIRPYIGEGGWYGDGFVAKLVQNPPPLIIAIRSKRPYRGSKATLIGSGFSAIKEENVVYFGTKKATVRSARPTSLHVTIPPKCKRGTVDVYVSVRGVRSEPVQFTVK